MLPFELLFFIRLVKGLYLSPKTWIPIRGPSPVLSAALPTFLVSHLGFGDITQKPADVSITSVE